MGHCSTILRQILHLVPRYVFERLAAQHHGGAALRTMTRWSQFVALVAAQLSGRASLRDLEASLAAQQPRLYHLGVRVPPRSSLARVNAEQPYRLYEALCAKLLERCSALAPRHGFRFKHKALHARFELHRAVADGLPLGQLQVRQGGGEAACGSRS